MSIPDSVAATVAVVLSTAGATAVKGWVNKDIATSNAKVKAVDALWADGVRAGMVAAPDKDSPEWQKTLYKDIGLAVVAGFSAKTQRLLETDTKGLSDVDKTDKRYWQQQIGSKRKDLRKALETRETAEKGGASNLTRTSYDILIKMVGDAIDRATMLELGDKEHPRDFTQGQTDLAAALHNLSTPRTKAD